MGHRIVMLGAPGAGKGTQAQRMAEQIAVPHISTGDIFRKNLKEGTELGLKVKDYLSSGALVPDQLTCDLVADRLAEADCAGGYILDGFPRSLPQAEALDAFLSGRGDRLDVAIDIDVPDEEIVDRLSARRTDPETGTIYNLKFSPPPADVADRLVHREDDQPETILQRLKVYHETTKPIIGYYREQGILKTIAGSGATPDEVFVKIEEVLRALSGG
jgi:adenylate kinase